MSNPEFPYIVPAGDAATMVVLGEAIDPELNARVRALAQAVEDAAIPGVREVVIAYCTLLIHHDPLLLGFETLRDRVAPMLGTLRPIEDTDTRLIEIPTVFGGSYGVDLPYVLEYHKLDEAEFLRQFTGAAYTVYMLGFSPGNGYFGGLPLHLAMPRLESPRERVPAGTVGIANQVTIYPLTSPGGWRWLGRTALKLFDPTKDPPTLLREGYRVRFIPISEEEYLRMGGEKA